MNALMVAPRRTVRPLGLRADHGLSPEQYAMIQRIADTDTWFVEARIRRKGQLPPERIQRALIEMKRYLALKALGHTGMMMVDDDADIAWHNFILFTHQYRIFCDEVCGRYIDHAPFTGEIADDSLEERRFYRNYAALFGSWMG